MEGVMCIGGDGDNNATYNPLFIKEFVVILSLLSSVKDNKQLFVDG